MIEIRIYDETEDYLFGIYKADCEIDALIWLKDQINALQRPVKIRIYSQLNK